MKIKTKLNSSNYKTSYYYYISCIDQKTGETLYYWRINFPRDARDSGWSKNIESAEKFSSYKDAWTTVQYYDRGNLKINKAKVETTIVVTEVPCDVPEGFEKYIEAYNNCLRNVY
jgi:hypothetical protein